jgi:hypothetical protein
LKIFQIVVKIFLLSGVSLSILIGNHIHYKMNMQMLGIFMDGIDDLICICIKSARHLRKLICVPSVCKLMLFKADDPVTETNSTILMICLRNQLHFLRCILWMHCESADIVIRCFI